MVSIIVAVAENGVIGDKNTLLWHISEDLKHFKAVTTGHPVIMGRKTYESLGRPLPNRTNVVITRQQVEIPGCRVVHSLGEAVALFPGDDEVFVIGGAQIYAQALPLADRFYLTRVFRAYEGDTHFPEWDEAQWRLLSSESFASGANYPYPFATSAGEIRYLYHCTARPYSLPLHCKGFFVASGTVSCPEKGEIMGKYFDMLMEDVRMKEGLHSCMNCGVCTGVCPAAEFYNYDPRQIVNIVQTRDDDAIEELLKSDTIWYCGECMSCRPRCPRGNTPGYVIPALRTLSQKLGFFVESEKGRQQLALKRIIGENILRTGYCIVPRLVKPELHPEQGPVWQWIYDNDKEVYGQFTPVYMRHGAGALRRLDEQSLEEINKIFEVSGGKEMFDSIEEHSDRKARELGYGEGADQQYMMDVFLHNNNEHY